MYDTPIQDEFLAAFGEEDSYQTAQEPDAEEAVEEKQEPKRTDENTPGEDAEAPQSGEEAGDRETPAEEAEPPEGSAEQETFTLKVNKEKKTVTRDQMIAYAQMGVDYDRVKAAAEQAKSDNTALKEQLADMQEGYDLLTQLAQDSKVTVPELLDAMRANRYKGLGLSDDAAKERVAREKAEKALEAEKAKAPAVKTETPAERAAREVADFRAEFPDVDISKELMSKLMGDVKNGMSLSQAYRKQESAEKDARIRQLEEALAAEKKNRENRDTSPGSQSDSGARRGTDKYDDFFEAFN